MAYLLEHDKLSHRIQGLVNGLDEEIKEAFDGALDRIAGAILSLQAKAGETESLVKRKKYLNQQKAKLEKVLGEIYEDVGVTIKGRAVELALAMPAIANTILVRSIKKAGLKADLKLSIPKLTRKRVLAWFESFQIEGLYFNDWMKKLSTGARERIVKATRETLLFQTSKKGAFSDIQKALDAGRHGLNFIAETSIRQAHQWAEFQYHMENVERISYFRFVAELDRKTTPLCRSLDGRHFKPKDAQDYLPPLHGRCRSQLLAVYKGFENIVGKRIARIDTDKHVIQHRDGTTSTTYKKLRVQHPKADVSYNEWMLGLVRSKNPADVAFAREALGPTRFNLVASGKLRMDSLYYRGKLRTIKELEKLI